MSLANCSRCGRVFTVVKGGRDICPACVKEEDEHYLKVFHYLSERPAATAQEIAQATEIDIKEILRFVREKRLRLVQIDTGLNCESCGIPITQGRFCEKCLQSLATELKNDLDKTRQQRKADISSKKGDADPKYLKERRGKGGKG